MGCSACGKKAARSITSIKYKLENKNGSTSDLFSTKAEADAARKPGDRLRVIRVKG